MDYHSLPKIDLHCHLDGSLRPETLIELADELGIALPSHDIDAIRDLMIAPESCPDLDTYLKRFVLPISVMQTAAALERIAFELFEDAALENVKYLEVRFAPLFHIEKGLSITQVLHSVIAGLSRAEAQYDIKGNFILSFLKTLPKDRIQETLDAGKAFLGAGVVAMDLAGSEQAGFAPDFIPYVEYGKELGYHITIHAGEQGVGQNVEDSISLLHAERIGHGIAIQDHAKAYASVKSKYIGLETCPSSNVQTKAVPNLESHPFPEFLHQQLAATINTDNRTVSNTTMTKEVQKTMQCFDLSIDDYKSIYRNSVAQAFTTHNEKTRLLAYLEDF